MRVSTSHTEVSPKFQKSRKKWKAVREHIFLQMAFWFEHLEINKYNIVVCGTWALWAHIHRYVISTMTYWIYASSYNEF